MGGPSFSTWQRFVLAAALPLVLCASRLNLDLWRDEVDTLDRFVSRGAPVIVTDYSLANNHVFYSLLLRPFYLLSDNNVVLRLPSLLFSIGTLVMVFRVAGRWGGPAAGVLATFTLGLAQMFLVHTMQIRGYGLSMFLAAWLADLAMPPAGRASWRPWATIALVGAGFLWVVPTNLLFFVPLAAAAIAWEAVVGRSRRAAGTLAAAWGAAALVGGLLYLPILHQLFEMGRQRQSVSWTNVFAVAERFFSPALRDLWLIVPLWILGSISWAARVRQKPPREQVALPLFVLAVVTGSFGLTALLGINPFERNYCPLLPLLGVLAGCLLAEFLEGAGRRLAPSWPPWATAVGGVVILGAVLLPRIWTYPQRLEEFRRRQFAQDGYYNYYAAGYRPSAVVDYLQERIRPEQAYLICYPDADHLNLWHYFRRGGFPLYRGLDPSGARSPAIVYAIAPEAAGFQGIAEKCGLALDEVRAFPLVEDFGYYRLYRSPQPLAVKAPP